ncbi:glycoside hydrolase family 13 protein [Schizophyllum amplum]|uniref:alpha-amylase n=1 Tax=Schizophyllum amplum TaxID=97359 RepID=A0A550CEL5_9AGAR|nr:glycoside hydrolase family 13 protein [Auriculariopsis ampla]
MMPTMQSMLLPVLIASSALAASADDWRKRTIYQLLTDRFALEDDSGSACDTSDRKYCGGTWKAVQNHLDYISGMGFDAIWISPVVKNVEGETGYGEAYHGYWTQDMSSLNDKFGTEDDLKSLVSAAHDKDIYVMVDVVVNHYAGSPSNSSGTTSYDLDDFSPIHGSSSFHQQCWVKDDGNQTETEQCWLGDDTLALYDINTEDDTIVGELNDFISNLVSTYNFDGVRIDTVKHIRKDFWPDFASSAGVFTIGEVLIDNVTYAADYTQVLDAILDYPTYFALRDAFTSTKGDLSALQNAVTSAQEAYKNGEFMTGSFTENHDYARLQSMTQDSALIKNAMSFNFIHDGIPITYYGQEQGYTGGDEPANREALWLSGYPTDNDLYKAVVALNAARKSAMSADESFLTTKMSFISQSDIGAMAISKPPLLGLFTNTGSNGSASFSVEGVYDAGETLVDVLTCNAITADDSGKVSASASGGMPQVLIPASSLKSSYGVCADQADGAMGVRVPALAALVAGTVVAFVVGAL